MVLLPEDSRYHGLRPGEHSQAAYGSCGRLRSPEAFTVDRLEGEIEGETDFTLHDRLKMPNRLRAARFYR